MLPADGCRAIEASDAGRRVFGIAVKPGTLAMHLTPPWRVRLWQHAGTAIALAAVLALIVVLVRVQVRRAIVPLILLALALLVIAIDDASFVGGVRPFDGGDDGLFYDGVGRAILQNFLAGDVYGALEGGEKVFYYGGPGLRYFRALEHVVFGESYLGYLSLVLLLPLLTWGWRAGSCRSAGRLRLPSSSWRSPSANCSAPPSSTTPSGRRAASPIRPPIFSSLPGCCRLLEVRAQVRAGILLRRSSVRCCSRSRSS